MLDHRRQHGLHIVDDHMIATGQKGPALGSSQQSLHGPRRQPRQPLTAGRDQIQHVGKKSIGTMLGCTALLQLKQGA